MRSPSSSLRTALDGYRQSIDRDSVTAGYAAVLGAVCVSALYVASVWALDRGVLDVDWTPYFATMEFHWVVYSSTAGLVAAAPAAFAVGVVGSRISPTTTVFDGALKGSVGAVATYVVAFVPTTVVLFALGLFSSESPAVGGVLFEALELSVLCVAAGFVLTSWLAVPVGCVVGVAYAIRRRRRD